MVLEIFVLEGDLVEAGRPLVQVELSASELNPDEVQATLDAFILARARLIAESRDEAPVWPQDVVVRQARNRPGRGSHLRIAPGRNRDLYLGAAPTIGAAF